MASRYKGSAVGVTWSVIQPLIMLSIYTFVFSTIFKSRWLGQEEAGSLGYALNLFTGLVLFNVVAEVMGSSTSLITSNKNYQDNFSSLYAAGVYILSINKCSTVNINTDDILLHSKWIFVGILAMDIAIMVALLLISLTISWTISSLSVYLRDFEQLMLPAISILMFMSAIFYPVKSSVSASFLVWITL